MNSNDFGLGLAIGVLLATLCSFVIDDDIPAAKLEMAKTTCAERGVKNMTTDGFFGGFQCKDGAQYYFNSIQPGEYEVAQ